MTKTLDQHKLYHLIFHVLMLFLLYSRPGSNTFKPAFFQMISALKCLLLGYFCLRQPASRLAVQFEGVHTCKLFFTMSLLD